MLLVSGCGQGRRSSDEGGPSLKEGLFLFPFRWEGNRKMNDRWRRWRFVTPHIGVGDRSSQTHVPAKRGNAKMKHS